MSQLRSYLTRSVRWRVWVRSDSWLQARWMWESAARPVVWEQILSLSEEDKQPRCRKIYYRKSCVKKANTWLKFMPFVCFMGLPTREEVALTSHCTFHESCELHGAFCTFKIWEKGKKKYIFLELTVRKSICLQCFLWSYMQKSLLLVIVSSFLPLKVAKHSSFTNLAHEASTGRTSAWIYLVTQSWSLFIPWESPDLSRGVKLFSFIFSPRITPCTDECS